MRIVIICGDRHWKAHQPIRDFVQLLPADTIVITGGASGADEMAWGYARIRGLKNIRMDAPWEAYGKRAGPVRNQWMLDIALGLSEAHRGAPVEVHAFHDNIAASKGTADMLGRGRKAGAQTTLHSSAHNEDPRR